MLYQPHRRVASEVTDDREAVLTLRFVTDGAVAVVQVRGDLDMDTSPLLTELLNHVVALHRPPLLVLDLQHLEFFCAAGIHALLRARETLLAQHAHLILRDPPVRARNILTITQTVDLFDIQTQNHHPPRPTRTSPACSAETVTNNTATAPAPPPEPAGQ